MKVHYSSNTPEWTTPSALFDQLNEEFNFTLDPCCTHENAKCEKHYTAEIDGLRVGWEGERVFMNPPYGRQIGKWMKKAHDESCKFRGALVVALVPARTDTAWWHDYVMGREIRFVRGRILFSPNGDKSRRAPFPSAIVIFDNGCHDREINGECKSFEIIRVVSA